MTRKTSLFLCSAILLWTAPSHAQLSFGELFKKKGEERVDAEEFVNQQSEADTRLQKGISYETAGNAKKAKDAYKSLVKSYPRSTAAAEAQFRYAAILEASGEGRKAFDAYQELLTNYRNTPKFSEAVNRQFQIAVSLRDSEDKGFFGIGAAIQPSQLIEMFQQISASAPQTDYAPKSLLNIGYVHKEQEERDEALVAFQKVVNTYPSTPYSTEAQYEIFQLRGVKAENSNSPVEDRAQVEAGIDFVTQNPEDARAPEIKAGMDEIENRSMEKLFTTGQFYEKSGKPESARVYYREVVKNPNTPWAAKAQERLSVLDNPGSEPVEKRAGFFGSNPLKKDSVEMRTSDDEVVPLPDTDAES